MCVCVCVCKGPADASKMTSKSCVGWVGLWDRWVETSLGFRQEAYFSRNFFSASPKVLGERSAEISENLVGGGDSHGVL